VTQQPTLSTADDHPLSIALAVWIVTLGSLAGFFSIFYNNLHQLWSFQHLQRVGIVTEGVISEVRPARTGVTVTYRFTSPAPMAHEWTRQIIVSPQQHTVLTPDDSSPGVGTYVSVVYDADDPRAATLLIPTQQFNYVEMLGFTIFFFVPTSFLCFAAVHVSIYSFIVWRTGQMPVRVSRIRSLL
jgi:hypothetical protein